MVTLREARSLIKGIDGLSVKQEKCRIMMYFGDFPHEDGSSKWDITAQLPYAIREEIERWRNENEPIQ